MEVQSIVRGDVPVTNWCDYSYITRVSYPKPKYGTHTPLRTVGVCYAPSHWLGAK